jgi:hypothetical protein
MYDLNTSLQSNEFFAATAIHGKLVEHGKQHVRLSQYGSGFRRQLFVAGIVIPV